MKPSDEQGKVLDSRNSFLIEKAPYLAELAEAPENGVAFWITTDDALRLRVGLWRVDNSEKGTVLLFPGRTEYIELQGRNAQDLTTHGYSVLTIDWRGHGLSDRVTSDPKTIHVHHYSDYQRDVAAMLRAVTELDLPKPWSLVANSMGGCIGLRSIADGLPVNACAFIAPMWGIKMSSLQQLIALPASWAACVLGKGHVYVPGHDRKNYASNNPFDGNRMTFDEDGYSYWVRQAFARPELQTAGSSMRWLLQSLLECRRLSKLEPLEIPCVAFCGDQDSVVDSEVIKNRMTSWPNGSFVEMQNAKHALLLEAPEIRRKLIDRVDQLFSSA